MLLLCQIHSLPFFLQLSATFDQEDGTEWHALCYFLRQTVVAWLFIHTNHFWTCGISSAFFFFAKVLQKDKVRIMTGLLQFNAEHLFFICICLPFDPARAISTHKQLFPRIVSFWKTRLPECIQPVQKEIAFCAACLVFCFEGWLTYLLALNCSDVINFGIADVIGLKHGSAKEWTLPSPPCWVIPTRWRYVRKRMSLKWSRCCRPEIERTTGAKV